MTLIHISGRLAKIYGQMLYHIKLYEYNKSLIFTSMNWT